MHNSTRSTHNTSTPGHRFSGGGAQGRHPAQGAAQALAALALFTAGGIHGAQAVRHLPETTFHGRLHAGFFLAAGLFQILAGVVVMARRHTTVVAAGNLALAAVWGVAVTVGLPEWLAPAGPEPVTFAGAASAGLALLASVVLVAARRPLDDRRRLPQWSDIRLPAPFAAAGVALVAVGFALPVPAQSHSHAAGADHTAHASDAAAYPSDDHAHSSDDHAHPSDPATPHLEDVHLHGLGGDAPDPGPAPVGQAYGPLAGTRFSVGRNPAAIAVDRNTVWVADREAGFVHRIDRDSGRPLGPAIQVGVHPGGIAVGEGSVWVTNAGSDTVSRLDAATGADLGVVRVGKVPVGVAVGGRAVWVANSAEGTVSRIDPNTGQVVTTPRISYGPTAITVGAGRAWVVASLDRAVLSLDPATGAVVTQTPVDGGATSIAFGHGSIWVASSSAGTVTRIDPLTGASIGVILVDRYAQPGQGPAALAIGASVWVLNNHDKTVIAIDPSTHAVSRPKYIDRQVAAHITPASLASGDGSELWATEHDSGVVVRIQTRKDTP